VPHAEFEDVLRRTPDRPFRKLIEDRLRRLDSSDPASLSDQASASLSDAIQVHLPAYRQALEHKFLRSKLFWEVSTCREAIANILEVAAETIPEAGIRAAIRRPLAGETAVPAALFEVATSVFVGAAYHDRKQRRFMAIRKGWLR